MSAKRDNNQHDDVIFRLNAPLGREEGERENWGRSGREVFYARYSRNIIVAR